jgi:luciferase-like monooxygenase
MLPDTVSNRIRNEVASWPDITVEAHRGGIVFFRVGRREIGHLHGNRFADLPFPVRIRKELVATGRAELHYLHPESGWVTRHIRGEQDLNLILDLFRLNYRRPWLERH